ncbi:TonB-dependent receptor domain-containing protein [Bacteroidota bacterium]
MKLRIKIFILLLFPMIIFAQSGVIKGKIIDINTNEPVPFANVVVVGTNIGGSSDFDGNFIINGVNPGFVRLTATAVGYKNAVTEELQITVARAAYTEIKMTPTQVKLQEVIVRASPYERDKESPLSLRTLGISEIEKDPGSNRDISKVIQNLPGVSSSVAYRNDVIIRGGGPSENRFYLDEIEIPTLNHFSTQGASGGPVGIINADFLSEVNLYSGAFPAKRGNALSSVIEMKMKNGNPDKHIIRGTIGASDLALTVEGPISKKSTFIVSARRSYLQFLFSALGLPFLPTYNDFQLKNRIILNKKNTLTFIGLAAIDDFKLNTGLKNPDEEQQYILDYLPVFKQWSYAAGVVYKHFGEKGSHTLVFSRNFLNNKSYKYKDNNDSDPNSKIYDYSSTEAENKLRYEYDTDKGNFSYNYGASLEYASYTNETFQKIYGDTSIQLIDYKSDIGLWTYGIFGQITKGFFNERLSTSLGLRTDANNYSSTMSNPLKQISPRLSASYVLTDLWYLNFNTGRYYQRPPYTVMGFRDNNGSLVNKDNGLKYISVDHIVGGVEFRPNIETQISLEGFVKYYDNYPFSVSDSINLASKGGDFGTFGDEEIISKSKGKAFGAEVYARGILFGKINAILSYTFVRSEFQDKNNTYLPSAWDNKHILNLIVRRTFKRNWDIGFRWRFVGGTPYTPWDYDKSSLVQAWDARGRGYLNYNQFNSLRVRSFHHLDIRVDKSYFFKSWSMTFYLDIQNVYNFKGEEPDNLIRQTDANGNPIILNPGAPIQDQRYALKTVQSESGTILPTIGVIIEFSR